MKMILEVNLKAINKKFMSSKVRTMALINQLWEKNYTKHTVMLVVYHQQHSDCASNTDAFL